MNDHRPHVLPPEAVNIGPTASPAGRVAVLAQEPTMQRQFVEALSNRYDLVVLRQIQTLLTSAPSPPNLIVMDSQPLLTIREWGQRGRTGFNVAILAVVQEAELESMGASVAELVDDFVVRPFVAASASP